MNDTMQNMYQKHEDANANNPEIMVLLIKVCGTFSAVHNVAWLEWGSDVMPKMWKALAEDECQAKIHHQVHDHAEQLQLFKDQVDTHQVCRVALEKEMMELGADLEQLKGEFQYSLTELSRFTYLDDHLLVHGHQQILGQLHRFIILYSSTM